MKKNGEEFEASDSASGRTRRRQVRSPPRKRKVEDWKKLWRTRMMKKTPRRLTPGTWEYTIGKGKKKHLPNSKPSFSGSMLIFSSLWNSTISVFLRPNIQKMMGWNEDLFRNLSVMSCLHVCNGSVRVWVSEICWRKVRYEPSTSRRWRRSCSISKTKMNRI